MFIKELLVVLSVICLINVCMSARAGKLYKWVDKQGNLHFSDSPVSVPPEYDDQVEVNDFGKPDKKVRTETEAEPHREKNIVRSSTPEKKKSSARSEVPYTAYEGGARRVIVPVRLNGNVTARMAVDTGAPGTVITPRLAERLGLFDSDAGLLMTRAGGIGGTVPAIWTIIDFLQVGDMKARFLPTTITELNTSAFDGLIGMDFLYAYNFRIDPGRKVLVLEEIPARSDMPGGHDEEWLRTQFRQFSSLRNQWREYNKKLARIDPNSESLKRYTADKIQRARDFASGQLEEAEKLFRKLNSYAIDHAVPMHWREY